MKTEQFEQKQLTLDQARTGVSLSQVTLNYINEQIEVYKRFVNNMSEREKTKNKNEEEEDNLSHAIPHWEPQSSDIESCNGSYK